MSDLVRYPPGENSVEPPERKAATCPSCARPVADAEWDHEPGCKCAACLVVCFNEGGFVCLAHARNLGPRALAAEAERDTLRARVAELEAALRALVAWVESDAVRGMSQVALIHGYRIDEAWHEQGAPAWKLVNAALAAPRCRRGGRHR